MFERFTSKARHAIVLAQEEARRLGHNSIGPEHLLLGLVGETEGLAAKALQTFGVNLVSTRTDVEALVGRGKAAVSGHIPFGKVSKQVLALSLREAVGLGHNYIGTEHVLLGLLREEGTPATQLLEARGISFDAVRQSLTSELARVASERTVPAERSSRTPAAEAVLATATALAGGSAVGSHHLLEAMVLVEGTLAGNTLSALGLDSATVAAKIEELGIDGTTDVTPHEAAARQVEIHIDDSQIRIILRDDITRAIAVELAESIGNPLRGDDPGGSALIGVWQAVLAELQKLRSRIEAIEQPNELTETPALVREALRHRLARRRSKES